MAFFSIIIPLYNKESFIEATLKSVLSQTFQDFEVIIVNDGSTDRSEEKALQFTDSRIRYFFKENGGVSAARNLGIDKADAQYVTFIDADDYWYPDFLETMTHTINQFPEQKVFSGAYEIEMSKNIFPALYSIQKTNDWEVVNYFTASLKESVIWTSCAVFEKTVFENIGNFDAKIRSGEDIDLWIRIGMKYPIVFSWKILARYVYDGQSLSKNESYINAGINYLKYESQGKSNSELKIFLDLNRFSLAIKSKLRGDSANFKTLYETIDLEKLPLRKRVLLLLPSVILKRLILVKEILAGMGLGNSVFK